ncbi:MAG: hypothetical protein KKA79_01015 [Nanoarchaeota archaeon]|nr:hypothetical protein [Nanoarchaeota archaeon]MCG2718162.1 hypothetical protein [Nanoarchaeota archaeon]
MNLKLLKEKDVPLLVRKRLSFEVEYPGDKTPSRDDIKKNIASTQKVKEDLVAVRHIYPRFGRCKAKIIAHVYNNVEDVKKYEPKNKKEEKKAAEGATEAPAKESPKAKAPAEQPKEEIKEEPKEEEKPVEEKKEE